MSGKRKSFPPNGQRGNAMVYVLVIVALFGALSFVLARQTDTSEAGAIASEQVEIYAGVIQQAAAQLKQSIEQMTFTGTAVSALDFVTPDDAAFDTGSAASKLFHPHGGGVVLPRIPDDAISEISTDPPARWYIGRFNNVEWTPSAADDVILTAHQITEAVCSRINFKLTGSTTIPETDTGDQVAELLIDEAESTAVGSNIQFTSAQCPGCFGHSSLCVKDNGVDAWSFYSIVAPE